MTLIELKHKDHIEEYGLNIDKFKITPAQLARKIQDQLNTAHLEIGSKYVSLLNLFQIAGVLGFWGDRKSVV